MRQLDSALPVADLHRTRLEAVQQLLGDTIEISDAEWREPSRLPGWSRAHVATHLARDAEVMMELTAAAVAGREPRLPSEEQKFAALERGAERSGLELQIDLDSSAGALATAWDEVVDWNLPVAFLGETVPLMWLPLARLHEVCVHHLDLNRRFDTDSIDPETAHWLLVWVYHRRAGSWGKPPIELISESAGRGLIGAGSHIVGPVRGTDADLWAWLAGRVGPDRLNGAGTLQLPLLAG